MKILSIGNSFSQDAHAYLPGFAGTEGNRFVNLYIGGCPLSKDAENIRSGEPEFDYELMGPQNKVKKCSIGEALCETDWDYVTVQQKSDLSGRPETFYPDLGELCDFIRAKCPGAEIVFHQTWAYDYAYRGKSFAAYGFDTDEMHRCILRAGDFVRERGFRVIPTGEVIAALRQTPLFCRGAQTLNRDGYHLSFFYGRYAAAATWFRFFGGDLEGSDFVPAIDGVFASKTVCDLIRKVVCSIVK